MKQRIYLDNSATTRVDDRVVEAMLPYFRDHFGNASSIHTFGQSARAAVEEARQAVADLLGADAREIVFTSGGTESNNTALWGVFGSGYRSGNHIVTTRIEHPAILATCKALQSKGAEVTYVPVDNTGRVNPQNVERAITDRTILISIMHANNETGVVQPIEEIGARVRPRGICMHTDAVQSVGKIPVNLKELGVDLLSLSGHKIHAPKGIGVLYVRKGTKLLPFMTGGSQERKRRAGTENTPGIVALGAAAQLAADRLAEVSERVTSLRDDLESRIRSRISGVRTNGDVNHRVPTITNLSLDGVEGEAALIAMDLEGVAISTGSACSSGSLEPSHVLTAMGLRPEIIQGSLRFSLCYHTTEEEIDRAVDVLARVTERLRRVAGSSRRVSA